MRAAEYVRVSTDQQRKRTVLLSITHKSSTGDRSQFDVSQTGQPSPHRFIARRGIVRASKIVTKSGQLRPSARLRGRAIVRRCGEKRTGYSTPTGPAKPD